MSEKNLLEAIQKLWLYVQNLERNFNNLNSKISPGGLYGLVPKEDLGTDGHIETTDVALLPIKLNMTFTPTDYRSFSWSAGTIYYADGTTQTVASGSSGTLSGTNYLYANLDTYPTGTITLSLTTTFSTAATGKHILIAICVVNSDTTKNCAIVPAEGAGCTGLTQIVAASQIVAANLAAIIADLGTVTAGEFRLGNGNNPGSGFTGIRIYKSGSTYHIESIVNDVIHTQQDENGITLVRTDSGDDENLILKYGSTIVGYIYPASDTMVILGNRDLQLASTSGYGISIHAGGLTSPTADDLKLKAEADVEIYGADDVFIEAGGDDVDITSYDDILLNPGSGFIIANGDIQAQSYNASFDEVFANAYNPYPDFLDDLSIIKAITAKDGKHLDMDSLHEYLRVKKDSLKERLLSMLDSNIEKAKVKLQEKIAVAKEDEVLKINSKIEKLETNKPTLVNKINSQVDELYKTHISVNSMLNLSIAVGKQLAIKVETLESKILDLETRLSKLENK